MAPAGWPARNKKLVLAGTFVHSRTRKQLEVLEATAVGVGLDGVIGCIETGETAEAAVARLLTSLGWDESDVEVVACKPGQFFFPGFIDTHVHAPQYPNVGIFGKTTILDWLQKYTFPLEASFENLTKARAVYTACVRRTLAHGTTTAAYFATIHEAATNLLADLCLGLGQRALIGRVCMDRIGLCPDYYRDESADEGLRATMATIAHMRRIDAAGDIVAPILTPRFAPSCSAAAMLQLADVHRREGIPIQTHISEHPDDVRLANELFPDEGSYAKIYDTHGLLTSRTILAHAVHLTEGEAGLVAARRAKVAHCPCSNACLTSGGARIRWLWDRGIDVGLGTDMSGGYSPSVLDAARQAALASRYVAMSEAAGAQRDRCKLTVDEVLFLATRGGADVVGQAQKLGGFDVGMQWDAQLVELNLVTDDYGNATAAATAAAIPVNPALRVKGLFRDRGNVDVFGWETWEEKITKWLYNGDDRNTKRVWVMGRLVHQRP